MRAVAFDAMGVLYRSADDVVDLLIPFARENRSPLSDEEIAAAYRSASRGEMTSAELWQRLSVSGGPVRLDRRYLAGYELTPGIVALLDELRDRGIWLGCITNDLHSMSRRGSDRVGMGVRRMVRLVLEAARVEPRAILRLMEEHQQRHRAVDIGVVV